MNRTALLILWVVLLVSMPSGVFPGGKFTPKQDYWMGLYRGSERIGDMHVTIKPDKVQGKAGFRKQEVVHVRTKEASGSYDVAFTRDLFASQAFFPILELVHSASSQEAVAIELRYKQDTIASSLTADKKTVRQEFPLSKEDRGLLAVGGEYDFGTKKLFVGQRLEVQHWYLKMRPDGGVEWNTTKLTLTVLRREKLTSNGVTYDVVVVSEKDKDGYETIRWQTANGEIIKQEVPEAGVTWVREAKSHAGKTAQ